MLLAFGPDDLQRLAIPIGIGIAVLLILVVPSLRRSMIDSYRKGKEYRERLTGKKPPEEDENDRTDAR